MPKETMFNFPLCLLSFENTIFNRLSHIIAYCIVDYAKKLDSSVEQDILDEELSYFPLSDENIPSDYKESNKLHDLILISCKRKGIIINSIKT